MMVKMPGKLKIATTDYRVNQPIDNFKLRVKIIQQKSLLAELFESEGETRDSNFLESEERTFSWQEKVFSPFEVKFYRDKKNCVKDIQKEYHERIVSEDIEGSRLYTYTNKDSYYHDRTPVTKASYKSFLSSKNGTALPSVMKNRKPFTERYNKKIVDENPSDLQIRSNHYLYKDKKIMYIMVDLTSKDEALGDSDVSEILLCTVTFDEARKVLTIDPDFTLDECYTVERTGMNYDFWIEHASQDQNHHESKMQKELHRYEIDEKKIYREAEIFPEIQLPAPNILRLFLTLDFSKTHGFPYDAVFITYLIDLPKHWSTNQRDKLSGRTQRCRMMNGVANFSYVTEIVLDFNLKCLEDENMQPSWPQLFVAVASLDKWTRYRIEGYASQPLLQSPGNCTIQLRTWRPVFGIINSLRRFFTGGTAELEDLTYSGIPRGHEGVTLDKTQLKVVPSGTIDLKMSIVQQSRNFTKDRGISRDALDRLNSGTLINSVDNVLEQFKIARERMIRARAMSS